MHEAHVCWQLGFIDVPDQGWAWAETLVPEHSGGFFVGLQGTEKDYVLVQPVSDGGIDAGKLTTHLSNPFEEDPKPKPGLSEAAAQRRDALLAWGYGAGHGLPQVG